MEKSKYKIVQPHGQNVWVVIIPCRYEDNAWDIIGSGSSVEDAMTNAFERTYDVYKRCSSFIESFMKQASHSENYDLSENYYLTDKNLIGEGTSTEPFKYDAVCWDAQSEHFIPYCR